MPIREVPSARKVLREALLAQSLLTATALGPNIAYKRPTNWPSRPVLVLTNVDENELRPECHRCRVQADLFAAGTESEDYVEQVEDIAAKLQAVARDCDGNWDTGCIRNCSAPSRLPSPETSGRHRIIVDFILEVTPPE